MNNVNKCSLTFFFKKKIEEFELKNRNVETHDFVDFETYDFVDHVAKSDFIIVVFKFDQ